MTQIDSPHSVSAHAHPHSASVVQVESSKLLPFLMMTCILSGIALGLSVVLLWAHATSYRELEREVRLQRLETDEMNVRLELAKIPRHQPGDKP